MLTEGIQGTRIKAQNFRFRCAAAVTAEEIKSWWRVNGFHRKTLCREFVKITVWNHNLLRRAACDTAFYRAEKLELTTTALHCTALSPGPGLSRIQAGPKTRRVVLHSSVTTTRLVAARGWNQDSDMSACDPGWAGQRCYPTVRVQLLVSLKTRARQSRKSRSRAGMCGGSTDCRSCEELLGNQIWYPAADTSRNSLRCGHQLQTVFSLLN